MAHRRRNQWAFSRSRKALIVEADRLFAQAKSLVAYAEVTPPPHRFWGRAAHAFEDAANHYREAGLGVMARVLYGYASDCFGQDEQADASARCRSLAESVPTYLEEPTNE